MTPADIQEKAAELRPYTFLDVGKFEALVDKMRVRAEYVNLSLHSRLYAIHKGFPVTVFNSLNAVVGLFNTLQGEIFRLGQQFADPTVDYAAANYTTFPIMLVPSRLMHHVPGLFDAPQCAPVFSDETRARVSKFLQACDEALDLMHLVPASQYRIGWQGGLVTCRAAEFDYDTASVVPGDDEKFEDLDSEVLINGLPSQKGRLSITNGSRHACRVKIAFVNDTSYGQTGQQSDQILESSNTVVGTASNGSHETEDGYVEIDPLFGTMTKTVKHPVYGVFHVQNETRTETGFDTYGSGAALVYYGYWGPYKVNRVYWAYDGLEGDGVAKALKRKAVEEYDAEQRRASAATSQHKYVVGPPELVGGKDTFKSPVYESEEYHNGASPGTTDCTCVDSVIVVARGTYAHSEFEWSAKSRYKTCNKEVCRATVATTYTLGAHLADAKIVTSGECAKNTEVGSMTHAQLPSSITPASAGYKRRRPECSNDESRRYTQDGDAFTDVSWDAVLDVERVKTVEDPCRTYLGYRPSPYDARYLWNIDRPEVYRAEETHYIHPEPIERVLRPHAATDVNLNSLKAAAVAWLFGNRNKYIGSTDFGKIAVVARLSDDSEHLRPTQAYESLSCYIDQTALVMYDYAP